MSAPERLPPSLREKVLAHLEPVSPLAAPPRRALAVALPVLALIGAIAWLVARRDPAAAPWSLAGGGVSALEWAAGLGLVWMALREAVPGRGFGAPRAAAAIAGAVGLELVLGVLLATLEPGGPVPLAAGAHCGAAEGMLGLPWLALASFLALRALPLRPRWSGALAGAAAGLFADAAWHLACAVTDLAHIATWHVGATLALALLGFASGSLRDVRAAGRR
jgi:hypothetical protein